MTTRTRCFTLAGLFLAIFTLAACGPTNYVRLQYSSPLEPARIQANAPTITIVEFTDARSAKDIGIRRDNTPFIPVSSVTAWVSEALEEELGRKGLQTRYVKSAEEAAPGEHVVTGTVLKVWLHQKSITDYDVSIEASVALDGNLPVSYRSEQQRQDIPVSDITEKQLTEGLRTLLANVVEDILAKIHNTPE